MQLKDHIDMDQYKDCMKKSGVHQQKYLNAILVVKEFQLKYGIAASELENYNKIVADKLTTYVITVQATHSPEEQIVIVEEAETLIAKVNDLTKEGQQSILEAEEFKQIIKTLKNTKEDAEHTVAEKKRVIMEQEDADFRRKLMIGGILVGAVGLGAYIFRRRKNQN